MPLIAASTRHHLDRINVENNDAHVEETFEQNDRTFR